MARTRLLLVGLMLLSGCRGGPVQQETDRRLLEMARQPFDVAPPQAAENKPKEEAAPAEQKQENAAKSEAPEPETDIQTVAFLQVERGPEKQAGAKEKYQLTIPAGLPGSETPLLPDISPRKMTPEQIRQTIHRLYPKLPPLPDEPIAETGPGGQAYTLADLQKLAVENSPTLRQAAADVENAKGNLIQARTYQNPTIAYQPSPNNNNSNTGARGGFLDQPLTMWGKRPLSVAAAQKAVDNAEVALRRARFDLTTNVRNAYFGLIVAQETMRVNRALAHFTNEIYRLYTANTAAGLFAAYEPAPLRAQAYTSVLAYKQAITTYIYAWKRLVAVLGLPQLPLTQVAGRVDRLIPYYDYDKVLAHVLANHTDVMTARNGIKIAQYNLKLARIKPIPDIDFMFGYWKEMTLAPYSSYYMATVAFPVPIFDQNKGNIISAQAALVRAVEESHRVENALTDALAMNYANYRNNLYALESYRRDILPDQITYYRGIFARRQADINASPADLVTAQLGLAASVQNYLAILGSLWSSVVSVADLIQTPDLFQTQLAQAKELPELPNLDQMPQWLCPHHRAAAPVGGMAGDGCPPAVPAGQAAPAPASAPALPVPRQLPELPAAESTGPPSDARKAEPRASASGETSAP